MTLVQARADGGNGPCDAELAVRRHHLIEEAKAELDLAYEEVKRAEHKIMSFEQEYNEHISRIDKANGVDYQAAISGIMAEKETVPCLSG